MESDRQRSKRASRAERLRWQRVAVWSANGQSPRHDYLYRRDGSWTMLPGDEGTTHGTWRIVIRGRCRLAQ